VSRGKEQSDHTETTKKTKSQKGGASTSKKLRPFSTGGEQTRGGYEGLGRVASQGPRATEEGQKDQYALREKQIGVRFKGSQKKRKPKDGEALIPDEMKRQKKRKEE